MLRIGSHRVPRVRAEKPNAALVFTVSWTVRSDRGTFLNVDQY